MTKRDIGHRGLAAWIDEIEALCRPESVHICDGSRAEYDAICEDLVKRGTFRRLNSQKKPNSYYALSDSGDVARVEDRTFICSIRQEDAGPTNNWKDPRAMKEELKKLFAGCMKGRTMYVVPYSMGPVGGPLSKIGVEITDSGYVAATMAIMTRVGDPVLKALGSKGEYVPCLHSVGYPLDGRPDKPWPCDAQNKYICHFPEENAVWSYGSGYGGNALLGKKCFALRLASVIARREGWLAEHMLILGVTNPQGRKRYMAAAFPSACGKTNLAMLIPSVPGWKVECVGDDIAWMRFGPDGALYAINPEAGFFGVAPGTGPQSNPNAMASLASNSIFTNTALTPDGDIWWEGIGHPAPEGTLDWHGKPFDPKGKEPAAHPNSRFAAPARQCPSIDPAWEDPRGVKIDAILFGGRRASLAPLVHESFSWAHGVFMGSIVASEKTAAAEGALGELRRDPFAMLPFCGYHMGDYFAHWLSMGKRPGGKLPRIFYVNWFRKDAKGQYLWPGYGENARVLEWVFARCEGGGGARKTPIGYVPDSGSLDLKGLDIRPEALEELLAVNVEAWRKEAASIGEYYRKFGDRLPGELLAELESLNKRLEGA